MQVLTEHIHFICFLHFGTAPLPEYTPSGICRWGGRCAELEGAARSAPHCCPLSLLRFMEGQIPHQYWAYLYRLLYPRDSNHNKIRENHSGYCTLNGQAVPGAMLVSRPATGLSLNSPDRAHAATSARCCWSFGTLQNVNIKLNIIDTGLRESFVSLLI